jgi:signal transduction histidine kinase
MTTTPVRSSRARRVGALVCVVGLAVTSVAYWIARNDVERLNRRNLDRSASAALLKVQALTAAVDQVLSTANGVVAASNVDGERFAQVLGPDVEASPTLSGIALLADGPNGVRVVSTVGETQLLAGREATAHAAGATAQLIAWQRTEGGYALAFASRVARNAGAAYLQVELPIDEVTAGGRFALGRVHGDTTALVVGNVASTDGLVRWETPVALGGTELTLFVAPGRPATGVLGIPLPTLILVVGVLMTAVAAALATALVRRSAAVVTLGHEKQALDDALAHARTVEAKLRASEERFRSILRNTPGVIATIDPTRGSCDVLNRPDLLGHPLEELRVPNGLATLVNAADTAEADAYWRQLEALAPDQVCETTLRVADRAGADHHLRFRCSALRRPGGGALFLGLISDVTTETERQAREAELEQALHRSQRLDAVGQLASGVAHDFNNLLMVIMGCAELLGDEQLSPHGREYATEIERAATRGSSLVRQLLAFGQRDGAQPELVDLNEVVIGMEPLLARTLGESVQLQLVTSSAPCPVLADPVQLEQVVLNLAINARDAMPEGGVLYLAVERAEDRVVLSVTDTGAGIDPAVRDTIFEPFVTTKAPGKGTGLGLATVASIVETMGGSIDVCSAPDQGTTFEIALPARDAPAPVDPESEPVEPAAGHGEQVLLVEDEPSVRAALTDALTQHGFVVTPVGSAHDALRALDARRADILVSDVVMPAMSGLELLRAVRGTRPDLPVVLMSGYSSELEDPVDAPVLRKPFTHRELVTAVHRALADRELDPVSGR